MTCDDTKCMPPTAVEFSFVPSELESSGLKDIPETPEDNETADNDTDSAPEKPVNWTINFNKVSDNEVDLVATAEIADGWYVYSQILESDDGPIPTSLNYEDSLNVAEWGTNVESASIPEHKLQMMDEVFEMKLTKFKHEKHKTEIYFFTSPYTWGKAKRQFFLLMMAQKIIGGQFHPRR